MLKGLNKYERVICIGIKLVGVVLFCTVLGLIMIVGAYSLPKTKKLEFNIESSAEILLEEGIYPALFPWCTSQVDNFSDALILQEIIYDGNESLTEKAMMNYYITNNSNSTIVALNEYYVHEIKDGYVKKEYSRYWHGYISIYKLFLYFFNLKQIRLILLGINLSMGGCILYICFKKNIYLSVAYFVTLLFLNPIVISHNMFFSNIYIIMNLALVLADLFIRKGFNIYLAFTFIGCFACYYDLLSYPFCTLGIPLIYIISTKCNSEKPRDSVMEVLGMVFSWGFGYAGIWVSKWIVGSVILKRNLFKEAYDVVKLRTSRDIAGTDFTTKDLFLSLLNNLRNSPIWIIFLIINLILIGILMKKNMLFKALYHGIPYMVIIGLVLLWLFVKGNHSYLHSFFTYRELSTVCFAVLCLFGYSQMKT